MGLFVFVNSLYRAVCWIPNNSGTVMSQTTEQRQERHHGRRRQAKNRRYYTVYISTISFEVENDTKTYTFTSQEASESVYPVGTSPIKILYNPQNPNEAEVASGNTQGLVLWGGIFLVLTLWGCAGLVNNCSNDSDAVHSSRPTDPEAGYNQYYSAESNVIYGRHDKRPMRRSELLS